MTKGPLHLLWVGRLTWKKNPGLALTLVHQLQQQGVAVHLTLVGEGEERPALDVQAEALGITKWLTWTGVCDHAQVWAHMARADVLLHTAWQEGFGNVLLEAQAVGLWAVAAPAEGVGENLVPGETGMIMPDWQPHHWTQAILAYRQQSPEAQAQHARQSRQRIQTHFGWDKHLQQWQEFLMC